MYEFFDDMFVDMLALFNFEHYSLSIILLLISGLTKLQLKVLVACKKAFRFLLYCPKRNSY